MDQKISLSSSNLAVVPNQKLNFDVIYNTDPVSNSTGLSLRLHFNSQELAFDGADNFFESNSDVRSAPAVNDDTSNFDGDPNTDKFILASWASFSGNWPGDDNATDTILFSPNFTAANNFDDTIINFTAADTAAGFDLQAPSATVNLLVKDPPVINEAATNISLDENTALNTEIGTISANDPDGDNGAIKFTISDDSNIDTDSDDEPAFKISEAGVITINDAEEIDFETNPSLAFEVTATDSDDLTDTTTVTVNLANIDEAPKVINELPDISVAEDSEPQIIDLSNVFSDPEGATVSPKGSTSDKKVVTLTREGNELSLNFVPNATGTAEITVTGTANGLSTPETFTVTIDGSNNPDAPIIDESALSFDVEENSAVDATVATVKAQDPDADDTISYAISNDSNPDSDGDGTRAFAIGATGAITVADSDELNFETNPQFELAVTTTDTTDLTDTATITINLTDIDEAPTIANALEDLTFDEDSLPQIVDLSNVFSDPDGDTVSPRGRTSNKDLVTLTREGNILTLNFVPDARGEATITVEGTANGLTTEESFVVNVNSVPDGVQEEPNSSGVFNFKADSNLAFDLVSNGDNPIDVNQINQVGIFLFDDASGRIGELNPGDSGYERAAGARARSIFSILSDLPEGFSGNTQQIFEASDLFNPDGENLFGLLLTPDNGENIFLSNSDGNVAIQTNQDNSHTINWTDLGADFNDIALSFNTTEIAAHFGTNRLLDFSDTTETQTVQINITREADFNNSVGLYEIDALTGAITTADGNSITPTAENASAYITAARESILETTLSTVGDGEQFTSGEIELEAGKTYAPIILVNGAENPTEVYTPFALSNGDGVNRVISLGDNVIGFEDFDDFDYNDMVVEFDFV